MVKLGNVMFIIFEFFGLIFVRGCGLEDYFLLVIGWILISLVFVFCVWNVCFIGIMF